MFSANKDQGKERLKVIRCTPFPPVTESSFLRASMFVKKLALLVCLAFILASQVGWFWDTAADVRNLRLGDNHPSIARNHLDIAYTYQTKEWLDSLDSMPHLEKAHARLAEHIDASRKSPHILKTFWWREKPLLTMGTIF